MILPQLASEILKQLSVSDIKIAAKDYGLSTYYFTQKIKSVDTDQKDLLRAVECLIKANSIRNERINKLYKQFLNSIQEYTL